MDHSAVAAAYDRQADTVYRICYAYMKNAADAEDMVQETFLRLIGRTDRIQSTEHEKAWLIVTASNLCKNQLRHWWRRTAPLDESLPAAGREPARRGRAGHRRHLPRGARTARKIPADAVSLLLRRLHHTRNRPHAAPEGRDGAQLAAHRSDITPPAAG